MEYLNLIHDYVDGSLEAGREEELFHAMASSEELRLEMKQLLAIKTAVRSDKLAFTPPAQSTINIYSELGFKMPGNAALIPTSQVGKLSLLSNLQKYSQGIAGGVISAVLTAFLIFSLNKSGNINTNNLKNNTQIQGGKNSELSMDSKAKIPIINNFEDDSRKNESRPPKTIIKYIYVDRTNNLAQNVNNSKQDTQDISNHNTIPQITMNDIRKKEDRTPIKPILERGKSSGNQFDSYILRNSNNPNLFKSNYLDTDNNHGIYVELQNIQPINTQNPTINPGKFQTFNNISLSLIKSLGYGLNIGLDYRRENFFQKFTGREANGDLYEYVQQPNFNSYGLILRYEPEWLSFNLVNCDIKPLSQIGFGGNNAGYIGRVMIGTKVVAYNSLSFILGVEGNVFHYYHQNTWFDSYKYGINYGISYGF
jgi:hypothetical protein